jgi:Ni/Fe-hydrogenase 1 B-type cytochrome subunit
MSSAMDDIRLPGSSVRSVYVYEWPVRVWHFLNAIGIIVLVATGYYIGNPFVPAAPGEATAQFFMGYVRFAHFAAGYLTAILFLGRIYWAIMGNHYARHLMFPPLFDPKLWAGAWRQLKYYLFVVDKQESRVGANPLDQISTFLVFTLPMIFLILTGFALYAEGTGGGSWQALAFGWIRYLFGDSQALHTWHHVAMWALLCYVIIHLYLVFRQEIMTNQSYVSTMVTGYRSFED